MKKIFLAVMMVTFFLFSNAAISDKIGLLKEGDEQVLTEKVKEFESRLNVKFEIIISEKEINPKEILKEVKNSIVINIIRIDEQKKLMTKLYVTKDIDIIGYKDEVETLLEKSEKLVTAGEYETYVFEVIGSIADIINLINADKAKTQENSIKVVIIWLLVALIAGAGGYYGFKTYVIYRRKKLTKCKLCNIEMDLVDEYIENKRLVKLYNCHVCGHSKKISFRD